MSADIWEPSPTEVREWLIVLLDSGADVEVQIRLDSKLLVCRAREIVAEAASATNPCLLRTNSHGSANSSDVWTGAREFGDELWSLLPIVTLAGCAHSIVAG